MVVFRFLCCVGGEEVLVGGIASSYRASEGKRCLYWEIATG
jgi:hypothetical protein